MITYPNAVDENGDVHNIGTITQENRADHKYFCLGCDGEMVPVLCNEDRESHFRHKVNDLCNPETYLHNLAKKYLAKQFETQKKFEVSYYASNECPRKESCQLFGRFRWEECSGTKLYTFDLKEKYDICQTEGVYNGYRADVLLSSSQNPETPPIFLEVSVTHDCTPEKLESGNRIIEMKIRSEDDFKRPIVENKGPMVPLRKNPLPQHSYRYYSQIEPEPSFIMFHHFDREFHHDDLKKLDFFALFEDGKIGFKEQFISCKNVGSKYLKASIFELSLIGGSWYGGNNNRYSPINLGVTQAMLHNQPIRHCFYCIHYRSCMVPLEIERLNPRTRQKEKIVQKVFNAYIKNEQIDKFKLAFSCNNWRLNEPLCRQVKSYYLDNGIFIWKPPQDGE